MSWNAGWRSRLPANRLRVSTRLRFEEPDQVVAGEAGVVAHGDDESEPRRVRVRPSRAGSSSRSSYGRRTSISRSKLARRARDEAVQLRQLRAADRGLHVGHFQVVADVAVDVLVIESVRQRAELLAEPRAAGVALAAGAVAVAAPVAERPGDARQSDRRWSRRTRLRPS